MAPKLRESISRAEKESELNRQSNIEYLLAAHQTFLGDENLDESINRYYRLRINSLLDSDKDSVDKLFQLADRSPYCARCGCLEDLKLRDFRRVNQSKDRKHCRKLKGICIQHCKTCNPKELRFKVSKEPQAEEKPKIIQVPDKPTKSNKTKKVKSSGISIPTSKTVVKPISQIKKSKSSGPSSLKPIIPDEKGPKISSRLQAFTWFLKE